MAEEVYKRKQNNWGKLQLGQSLTMCFLLQSFPKPLTSEMEVNDCNNGSFCSKIPLHIKSSNFITTFCDIRHIRGNMRPIIANIHKVLRISKFCNGLLTLLVCACFFGGGWSLRKTLHLNVILFSNPLFEIVIFIPRR